MKDHHNIFFYYRGSHESQAERDRQLENNTTKALINTLELSAHPVAEAFLHWVGIEPTGPVEYELQCPTVGCDRLASADQRLLLGLVPADADTEPAIISDDSQAIKPESLPDAWICGDGCAVLVESKVVGALDPGQWAAHRARLSAGGSEVLRTRIRTWPDVYVFFKELQHDLGDALDAQSRFLISQFTEYLELIGQARFSGIAPELFDYFVDPDDDVKPRLRGVMTALAREVLQALQLAKLNQGFYKDFRVGNLWQGNDHIWAAFGPKDKGYRDVAVIWSAAAWGAAFANGGQGIDRGE